MGLRRNSLELRDGVVKFVLSDSCSRMSKLDRNIPCLCFHQAAEAIRGGWSANSLSAVNGCDNVRVSRGNFLALIALEPITPQNAMIFKAVRLRALQDTPSAFGSTYAKESQLADADWIKRAVQWNGERSAAFLAMDSH